MRRDMPYLCRCYGTRDVKNARQNLFTTASPNHTTPPSPSPIHSPLTILHSLFGGPRARATKLIVTHNGVGALACCTIHITIIPYKYNDAKSNDDIETLNPRTPTSSSDSRAFGLYILRSLTFEFCFWCEASSSEGG